MVIASFLALGLFVLTFCIHYCALHSLSKKLPDDERRPSHLTSLFLVFLVAGVHVLEILIFSGGYAIAVHGFEVGGFKGSFTPGFQDYFFYSLVTYTTVGISSFYPENHLKVISGIEALAGFMMITWSASFLYSVTRVAKGKS